MKAYAAIIFLTTFLLGLFTEWPEGDISNTGDIVAALFLFPIMIWIETKWIKMKTLIGVLSFLEQLLD